MIKINPNEFDDCKNEDGTYNGVKFFARMTGLSEPELKWTYGRMKELYKAGTQKEEAIRIVKEEAAKKPWIN